MNATDLASNLTLSLNGSASAWATVTATAEALSLNPDAAECSVEGGDAKSVDDSLVAVGTLLVIAASFISCLGINLQKSAHNENEARLPEDRTGMMRSWRWWLGISCMVCGSIFDVVALLWVPMSRVAALGACTIVANIIITPCLLKERVTRHDLVGCLVVVAGTATSCYFGVSGEKKLPSKCLLNFFVEPLFLVYITLILLMLAVLFYLILTFKRMEGRCHAAGHLGAAGQPARLECVWYHNNIPSLRDLDTTDTLFPFVTSLGPQFYPAVHAIFAGACGAQSVMFAKAVLKCFESAVGGDEVGMNVLYIILFMVPCAFCLWCQLRYLNVALQIYCDAVFVLPVYQAVWICTGVGSGLVYYQEYRSITGLNIGLFAAGIVGVLVGLLILSRRRRTCSRPRVRTPHSDTVRVTPLHPPAVGECEMSSSSTHPTLRSLSSSSPLSLRAVLVDDPVASAGSVSGHAGGMGARTVSDGSAHSFPDAALIVGPHDFLQARDARSASNDTHDDPPADMREELSVQSIDDRPRLDSLMGCMGAGRV